MVADVGRAAGLYAYLPNLVPDDPALAAVIAEEMAKAFGVEGGESGEMGESGEITQEMAEKIYEEMMSK